MVGATTEGAEHAKIAKYAAFQSQNDVIAMAIVTLGVYGNSAMAFIRDLGGKIGSHYRRASHRCLPLPVYRYGLAAWKCRIRAGHVASHKPARARSRGRGGEGRV